MATTGISSWIASTHPFLHDVNSHLLAQCSNVPRSLDGPLSALMVLVKLITETLKHRRILVSHQRHRLLLTGLLLVAAIMPLVLLIALIVAFESRHIDWLWLSGGGGGKCRG